MIVAHNLAAINTQRQFGINRKNGTKSVEKLSSGYRINRAADDAAGLSISEKMRRQIRGLSQASINTQEGISLIQVADGAMEEIHEMLQRTNELAVKAANGTLTIEEREFIQQEIEQIKDEIDGLSDRATYNEIPVLKGKDQPEYKISEGNAMIMGGFPAWAIVEGVTDGYMGGTYTTQEIYRDTNGVETTYNITHEASTIDFSSFDGSDAMKKELMQGGFYTTCCTCNRHYSISFSEGTGSKYEESGRNYIYTIGLDNVTDASTLIDAIIAGTDNGNPLSHYTGLEKDPNNSSKLVVYDVRSNTPLPAGTEYSGTWLNWPDATYDDIQARMREGRGTFGTGVAYGGGDFPRFRKPADIYIQVGSEAGDQVGIELPEISCLAMGIDTINVTAEDWARDVIDMVKKAIEYVNTERSRMGAYQNRLEHTYDSLNNVVENTQAAEARIRDTDMAKEMVNNANHNILLQAGQTLMAQANQSNQGVLNLLG